ncbi:MAG: response regulator [Limisphaerales bacterium]
MRVPTHGILVVDDEPSVIAIVGQMLKGIFNGPIFFASTTARAAELWQEYPIKLLITDMTLGEGSGDTLATNFIRFNPQGRVIIITGWDVDLDEVERTIGRRIPVLRKPFSPEELQEAISE